MVKTTSLREALLLAVEDSAQLDDSFVSSAWRLAVQWKDQTLISAIAGRPGLPSDVLTEASKRSEIPVRVAYLTRKDLPHSELLEALKIETRAGVLGGVCREVRLKDNPDIAKVLEAHLLAKPTKALAEAVFETEGAGSSLYAAALCHLGKDFAHDGRGDVARLVRERLSVIASHAPAAEHFLANVDESFLSSKFITDIASAPGVSLETRQRIVDCGVSDYVDRINDAHRLSAGSYPERNARRALAECVEAIMSAPDLQASIVEHLGNLITAKHGAELAQDLLTAYDPGVISADQREKAQEMVDATSSADEARLRYLFTESQSTEALCGKLLFNDAVPTDLVLPLLLRVADRDIQEAFRYLKLHPERTDLVTAVYASEFSYALSYDHWRSFPSPAQGRAIMLEVGKAMFSEGGSSNYRVTRILETLVEELEADDPLIAKMPWAMLEERLQNYYRNSTTTLKMARVFSRLQVQYLGTDNERWDAVAALADGFTGSLEELVMTAAAL